MAIDYPAILSLREEGRRFTYSERDTMLYALGVGMGDDPLDESVLPFVYERELRAVPTLATVVAWGAGVSTEKLGVNYRQVLHGEEQTILHRPMPVSAMIVADSSVSEVYDKGEGRGAVIVRRTVLRDEADGQAIATLNRTIVARADGGGGGSLAASPTPHPIPERTPDVVLEYQTHGNQAALYRLCGDRNPLHIDPERGRAAGFKGPILHGLCTYGFTCRAVLQAFCDQDPSLIASHQVRFSSPVYPGESLQIALWRDGPVISFEATVKERGAVVIRNGKSLLRE